LGKIIYAVRLEKVRKSAKLKVVEHIPGPQILIARLPYEKNWETGPILTQANKVDIRGLICLSMPLHVEAPGNGARLVTELQDAGLTLVALVCWHRDRHVVTTRSRRLTSTWEPLAVMCRSQDWHIDRDGPARPRRGAAGREEQWDEDEFLTCSGDHWPVRCDGRDRRLLPAGVTLNLLQLGGLAPGDSVLDPWGNPAIKEQCDALGLKYEDGGLPSRLRSDWAKKATKPPKTPIKQVEDEDETE
jgi:hypothetical protein